MQIVRNSAMEHPLNGPAGQPADTRGGYLADRATSVEVRQVVAIVLVALGMIGVVIAWFGISGTLDPGKQMPYLASGGIGGAAAIAVGVAMYISHEHVQDRAVLGVLLQRLDEVESALRSSGAHES